MEGAGEVGRVGIPGLDAQRIGNADHIHLVNFIHVPSRAVARSVELELAADLHLHLHGQLVEIGKTLLGADDQRNTIDPGRGQVRRRFKNGQVERRRRVEDQVGVGNLLIADNGNLTGN